MSSPDCARSVSTRLTGWPSASLTTRRRPSWPPSVSCWEYSSPARPVLASPTVPEHLRGEVPLRIAALGLDDRVDPLDPELLDPVPLRRVHLVAQVDEGRLAVAELLEQVVGRNAEQRRQSRRDARGIVDQERVREDRDGVLGDGELHAVAVEDRAAASGDDHVLDLLLDGARAERPGLDRADPGWRAAAAARAGTGRGRTAARSCARRGAPANPSGLPPWWRSAAWGLAASWLPAWGSSAPGRPSAPGRRVGVRRDGRLRRDDALGGGARVDGRVRLQVAHLGGLGQHEPELGRRLLDALAAREAGHVLAQPRVLALELRRRGRPCG